MNPGAGVTGHRDCCVRMRVEGRRQAWMPCSEIHTSLLFHHSPRFRDKRSDKPREDGAMGETPGD